MNTEPNAIPNELRDAPLDDVLAAAGCSIGRDEQGRAIAIDDQTGEPITTGLAGERLNETWEWLRRAHGRFAEFERETADRVSVVLEVRDAETGDKLGRLLAGLGYQVEVRSTLIRE